MHNDEELDQLAAQLGELLRARGWRMAAAESCTGGWLAAVITDVPNASSHFDRGFIPYCNAAKTEMLGVDEDILKRHGAVSEEAAEAMVAGALAHSDADIAVSITGIAGPDGGSDEKPVGLVWFAFQRRGQTCKTRAVHFDGDRNTVRRQTVQAALWALIGLAESGEESW